MSIPIPAGKRMAALGLAVALLAAAPAQAGPRLIPGPLVGTGLVIGGLALGGTALAIAKARAACRADPACVARHRLPFATSRQAPDAAAAPMR